LKAQSQAKAKCHNSLVISPMKNTGVFSARERGTSRSRAGNRGVPAGAMSELELSLFRQRSQEALKQKARRGALWRRRKNLHTRPGSAPRSPRHAEAAEAIFATHLSWSDEDRALYFVGNLLPFSRVERRPRLYRNYVFTQVSERNTTGCARKRKIEPVRIGSLAVILTGAADALFEKQPQFVRIEVRPSFEKKIFRHFHAHPALSGSPINISTGLVSRTKYLKTLVLHNWLSTHDFCSGAQFRQRSATRT
jgi:hypothetical protein